MTMFLGDFYQPSPLPPLPFTDEYGFHPTQHPAGVQSQLQTLGLSQPTQQQPQQHHDCAHQQLQAQLHQIDKLTSAHIHSHSPYLPSLLTSQFSGHDKFMEGVVPWTQVVYQDMIPEMYDMHKRGFPVELEFDANTTFCYQPGSFLDTFQDFPPAAYDLTGDCNAMIFSDIGVRVDEEITATTTVEENRVCRRRGKKRKQQMLEKEMLDKLTNGGAQQQQQQQQQGATNNAMAGTSVEGISVSPMGVGMGPELCGGPTGAEAGCESSNEATPSATMVDTEMANSGGLLQCSSSNPMVDDMVLPHHLSDEHLRHHAVPSILPPLDKEGGLRLIDSGETITWCT